MSVPQMKSITGGSGTCGYAVWTGDNYIIGCNVSKSKADDMYNHYSGPGRNWCCDSCSSTWYCGVDGGY